MELTKSCLFSTVVIELNAYVTDELRHNFLFWFKWTFRTFKTTQKCAVCNGRAHVVTRARLVHMNVADTGVRWKPITLPPRKLMQKPY